MRYEKNFEIKRKEILFIKKVMVSAVAFLIVFSMAAVDRNCSWAFGREEKLIPQIILVEEGKVRVESFLGEFLVELQDTKFVA